MKKISVVVLMFFSVVLFSCSKENKTTPETKSTSDKVDSVTITKPENPKGLRYQMSKDSKLEWMAKKVTGEHHGTVDIDKGEVFVDNGVLTGGNFAIDMQTIKVLGMDDTSSINKLTNHLKSDDFFSSQKFPTGRFMFTSVTPLKDEKGNNYMIKGFLMLKDIKNEITFPAKVDIVSGKVTGTAEIIVDRTKWDVKFRSGKFFENLGDNLIYDDFTINVFFTAG